MKTLKFLLVAALLATLLPPASAQAAAAKNIDPNPAGKKVCETVSMITGVAISPLLGVGAVGMWQDMKAKTPEEKAQLPWFANKLFYIPALLLVGACFLKDTAGIAIPGALKKPFDVAETAEHKISGLVATAAFVPIAAAIFHAPDHAGASLAAGGLAAIDLHWIYNALMIPVAMAAFFIVFLASNAINVLILLSPFSTVDAALKAIRAGLLATVAGTSFANPWMGAAWALMVILFAYLIAGWSFRLSHFGAVFVWDFFTARKRRFQPEATANRMFLGTKIQTVPTRTYGRLIRAEGGELVFNYRPWLVLPPRTLVLPAGKYEAGRGIFYSEILRAEGDAAKTVILLPPRYLGHEAEISKIYNLAGVRDVGIRAAWAWFKSLFTGKTATA